MTKYLLLKHYRGAPEAVNAVPMDQWTPEEVEDHLQFMADFAAMDVQRALQVVPRQYSRVLAAVYIPKAESELSARLRMGIKRRLWHDSRVQGLRLFWGHYLRRLTK